MAVGSEEEEEEKVFAELEEQQRMKNATWQERVTGYCDKHAMGRLAQTCKATMVLLFFSWGRVAVLVADKT